MRKLGSLALLFVMFWVFPSVAAEKKERPEKWARPVKAEFLRNCFQLDNKVYRAAQPAKKGFLELRQLGVTDVLNLRDFHSDDEDANGAGLNLHRVKMEAGDIETASVVKALRVIRNAEGPVVIHCWHGADRTGMVAAFYRILFQSWSKEDAIDELVNGGYGYHAIYKNIPEFIRSADIEELRRQISTP
ncbi:MAG: tyrosine-protein phosphatase [Nitrospiraceae bacterium]|nr:tyrosine-protein phosphatase [Nitrospiraceae bacterium]